MILSPRQRRQARRAFVTALILSLIVHLAGIGLWNRFAWRLAQVLPKPLLMASLQQPPPPQEDVIRLEQPVRVTASRTPHQRVASKVAPRPRSDAIIPPSPHQPRHELAHNRNGAPAQATASAAQSVIAITHKHPKTLALAPVPRRKPALSDRQIGQLGQEFSKTIADSRHTLADVQASSEQTPVVTVKHYTMTFNGIHQGMNAGDGDIWPISMKRIGNENWYYVRYTYMYADGTVESDKVPWPVHYPIDDDPFARKDPRIPIQPPPPGYEPDRPLKPILQRFFATPATS